MDLRPYQFDNKQEVSSEWDGGLKNILSILPTGGGKTVIFSDIVRDHNGASCVIAHRQELVTQISLALARDGVRHRIIGPKKVVKLAVKIHMEELGRSFYDPSSRCAVAGVDTLVLRGEDLKGWLGSVTLWVMDEAHHVLRDNKWGKAVAMFPNAKGLGVTATPIRADGKGLGRHADGVFDTMVIGPSMRDLINMGFLTDYRVFVPPLDLDLSQVPTSVVTGDWNPNKLKTAVRKSPIVGDVVKHYLRIAKGKRGITFATDVETATDIAKQFNLAGVPAAVVSSLTSDTERVAAVRRFKNGKLLQLVNVDIFGEGFDLPAIEVVSMARPTQSYSLFAQQFGRALRIMDGKLVAIIIDHVGNCLRHGLPDAHREWTLDRRDRRSKGQPDDVIPTRGCTNCASLYERIYKACPYCGHVEVPASRSGPEFVDGDLTELDAATLAAMRGEIAKVDGPFIASRGEPVLGQMRRVKLHVKRQEAQAALRASIEWWAGYQRADDREDHESYKRFYWMFGIDVLSAQALGTKDALILAERINGKLWG